MWACGVDLKTPQLQRDFLFLGCLEVKKKKKKISRHIILCSLENILLLKASEGSYQTVDESSCPTIVASQLVLKHENLQLKYFTNRRLSPEDFIIFRLWVGLQKSWRDVVWGWLWENKQQKQKKHLCWDNCCLFSEHIWDLLLHVWIFNIYIMA